MTRRFLIFLFPVAILAACAEDRSGARGVSELVENPILLEAAIVRCSRDRSESRYEQECINAREAVNRVQVSQEAIRRAEDEVRSQAKRRSLRRTQEALAEEQRRVELERQRREEAEYLAQFGVEPSADQELQEEVPAGNEPLAVLPESDTQAALIGSTASSLLAEEGGNAPVAQIEPVEEIAGNSLPSGEGDSVP
jgi:hypothetical protein